MKYADIIAREVDSLSPEKQAEVLDFIGHLKVNKSCAEDASIPKSTKEIEAFFRSFNVDTNGYKFDREEANAK